MYVAKTQALISCVVTAQLICVFVFAYAKVRFSHDAAQIQIGILVIMKLSAGGNVLHFTKYSLVIIKIKVMVECLIYFTSVAFYTWSTYTSHRAKLCNFVFKISDTV